MYSFKAFHNPDAGTIPFFCRAGLLFLESRHLLAQPCRPLFYCALLDERGTAVIRLPLFLRDGWLVSPCAASFGGLEFPEDLPEEELGRFVAEMVRQCRNLPVQGIRIVAYPDCYLPIQARRQRAALAESGFRIQTQELNHHLPVTHSLFTDRLHPSERRRLRKCREAGFTSGIWSDPDTDELFSFIQLARLRKNRPLTITRDALHRLLTDFPAEFRVFTVRSGRELAAACIGVRISSGILYYFLPADAESFLRYSPSVLLVETLYEYCRERAIALLDLGISTSKAVRNEGLIRFKNNLGAESSFKPIFEKIF